MWDTYPHVGASGMNRPRNVPGHVFISYRHEDSAEIEALQARLDAAGIPVWRDKAALQPGEDWRARIRRAITDDALVFLACFSTKSVARSKSWQNEEMILAIDQLRQRHPGEPWFIPVRLDDCDVPDIDIGGGRTLSTLQHCDLFGADAEAQADRLVSSILRILRRAEGAAARPLAGQAVTSGKPADDAAPAAEIRFRQFVPADLGYNCVVPYALDDQWVPRHQLRIMQNDGASLTDLGELRDTVIRREYVRSLITAERIVINRSFLFRNPVLAAGYTANTEGMTAFAELLHSGAIVLFLTTERSPLQSEWAEESEPAMAAARALEPILRSVRAWCVRFSWEDDNSTRLDDMKGGFANRIKGAVSLDHKRFLEDVQAVTDDVRGFRSQLALLPRLATPTQPVPITRSNLYAEYIVRDPRDIGPGRYDFTKPYVVPLKWLFDLIYNSNLATELQLALATPADSAHRSVVHNPNFFQDDFQGEGFDPARVRAAIMETVLDALFWHDFTTGALSAFDGVTLPQVVTIRRSETWLKYSNAVNVLLEEPWLLPHPERGLPHVYRCYDELIGFIGGRAAS